MQRVSHLDYIRANHLDSNQTWNETGGITENNSMICLQTHTHTHTDLYLPPHAQKHTRACVRAPRHGSCILLFLSLSVLSLIWFPLGKTSLAWWDLIWPACHSYFSFFFSPRISIVWLTYQLMAWLGADKPAIAADRLKNCLAEWWATAAEWMIGGREVPDWD